jgi:hypothetical protein
MPNFWPIEGSAMLTADPMKGVKKKLMVITSNTIRLLVLLSA